MTYDLALLTEESEDDRSCFEKDYFWCIDPLDGTLPFTRNEAGYSVSIGLVAEMVRPESEWCMTVFMIFYGRELGGKAYKETVFHGLCPHQQMN